MLKYVRKHGFVLFASAIFSVVIIAGIFAVRYFENMGRQELQNDMQAATVILSNYLSSEFQKIEGALKTLSAVPALSDALRTKEKSRIQRANSELLLFNRNFHTTVSYLMDSSGMTIASSNKDQKDSFVGHSYAFRPYFKEAMNGKISHYFALGVTSLRKGYYLAAPVKDASGNIIGVLAMKKELEEIEKYFVGNLHYFLINEHGIILMSSRPELALRSLWPIDKETERSLIESRQFGDKPFAAVMEQRVSDGSYAAFNNSDFLVFIRPVSVESWSAVILAPTGRIDAYRTAGILITVFVLCVIFIPIGLYFHKAVLYRKSKELQNELSETKAFLEKKVSEKTAELREREARFRATFEQAAVGIAHVALDGHWLRVNQKLCDIVGYTREELLTKTFQDITHPDDLETDLAYVRQVLADEIKTYSMEKRYFRKDGSIVWIDLTVSLVRTEQGEPKYFIPVIEDISRRKEAEHELSEYRKHLETLVGERTATLEEKTRDLERSQTALQYLLEDVNEAKKELEAANEKLKELDRLKSMFIASMSHELRTPLNSIIGFTGIILQGMAGEINEEQRDQLGRVSRAGRHLLSLITDVIDIAKIESGKIEPYPEEFLLSDVINEACDSIKVQLKDKGLELKKDLQDAPVRMKTDRKRLLQCLLNLLSNAVKFTEKGFIHITARGIQNPESRMWGHPCTRAMSKLL